MNHNSHYLKLLKIPIWHLRGHEGIETVEEPLTQEVSSILTPDIETSVDDVGFIEIAALEAAPVSDVVTEITSESDSIEACTACQLHKGRTQVITGMGPQDAKLFVITEAPTFNEDIAGKPFADEAERLFINILQAIGYDLSQVYITPYVKCSPYQTFITHKEEEQCFRHLMGELMAIKPEKVLLLGRNVSKALLNSSQPFDELRMVNSVMTVGGRNIPTYVSYNPYQLLKFPEEKRKVWMDIKRLSNQI